MQKVVPTKLREHFEHLITAGTLLPWNRW